LHSKPAVGRRDAAHQGHVRPWGDDVRLVRGGAAVAPFSAVGEVDPHLALGEIEALHVKALAEAHPSVEWNEGEDVGAALGAVNLDRTTFDPLHDRRRADSRLERWD